MHDMRRAKAENMEEIITKIVKEIQIGHLVSIRDLMKKVHVSSPDYLENSLNVVLAYHLGRAEKILETEGREKALAYAEKQLVPQVEHCKGLGSMVKEIPLINVMRENASRRSEEVISYFKKNNPFMVEEENNQLSVQQQ